MAQYAKLFPNSGGGLRAYVEVDLDPTFSDAVSEAYTSALIYIPSSAQPDLAANAGPVVLALLETDGTSLGIHYTGGLYKWYSGTGAGADFAPVLFDQWVQVEFHVTAGSSTFDVRLDGTLYTARTSAALPVTGVNYWDVEAVMPPTWVGDGGGTTADDWIGVDELAYSTSNWISQGGTVASRWSFDGADPLGSATANYPTPPWTFENRGDAANIVITTGGGSNPDDLGGGGSPVRTPLAVLIDSVDVTGCCIAGSWTPRLNRPAQASVTCPMDCAIGDVGSRLKIYINSTLVFHGLILNSETDTNKDTGTTVYNAMDPMELWQWRPVRADDGDFSKPAGRSDTDPYDLFENYVTGSLIMEAVLKNSEGDSTAQGNAGLPCPDKAEGPTFLTFGTFAAGGADLRGAPSDWPMTIAELAALLISTGELDLVIEPTDPGGGVMGTVKGYNGRYGTDRSGSILFSYGMGAHNVDSLRWNRDMTNIVNKYWLYGGPRKLSAADPQGDQHWTFNVTGDDGLLCGNSLNPTGIVNGNVVHGIGGALPGRPRYDAPGLLGNRLDDGIGGGSRNTYGVRMKIDIFDASDDASGLGPLGGKRTLYRRQWQEFSWFASVPREIIHITPTRDTEIGTFGIGDIVGVEAHADVRGGFSGVQRVYEYTISWDQDSVLTLSELQTSSDSDAGR